MRRLIVVSSVLLALCIGYTVPAQNPTPKPKNEIPLYVDLFKAGGNQQNRLYVTLTLCAPGHVVDQAGKPLPETEKPDPTTTKPDPAYCQTIDHIMVDTAASGLRILSEAITNETLRKALKTETTNGGGKVAECMRYDGHDQGGWVQQADLWFGDIFNSDRTQTINTDSTAMVSKLPFELLSSNDDSTVVNGCDSASNKISDVGFNGTIGVSVTYNSGDYYVCDDKNGCLEDSSLAANLQVENPVRGLSKEYNNGVIIQLDSIKDNAHAAKQVGGTMTLGIGTGDNNQLEKDTQFLKTNDIYLQKADIYTKNSDPSTAKKLTDDIVIDSGTPHLIIGSEPDDLEPTNYSSDSETCHNDPIYYPFCPTNPTTVNLTLTDASGATATYPLVISSVIGSNHPTMAAFDSYATRSGNPYSFLIGLPFFYGRKLYFAFDGANLTGPTDPNNPSAPAKQFIGPFYGLPKAEHATPPPAVDTTLTLEAPLVHILGFSFPGLSKNGQVTLTAKLSSSSPEISPATGTVTFHRHDLPNVFGLAGLLGLDKVLKILGLNSLDQLLGVSADVGSAPIDSKNEATVKIDSAVGVISIFTAKYSGDAYHNSSEAFAPAVEIK